MEEFEEYVEKGARPWTKTITGAMKTNVPVQQLKKQVIKKPIGKKKILERAREIQAMKTILRNLPYLDRAAKNSDVYLSDTANEIIA